jgi:hypothetical protein
MYDAGARGSFDMLSMHLYDDPDDHGDWNLWDQAFVLTPNVRSIMNANGDQSVPIAASESGGPVPKYTEAQQANIVDHAFSRFDQGQLSIYLVYTMMDDGSPGFGMLRADRSQRPAFATFQTHAH